MGGADCCWEVVDPTGDLGTSLADLGEDDAAMARNGSN